MKKNWFMPLVLSLLVGCAGLSRSCSGCNAENFGADWIIVQYGATGTPINCWQERDVSVDNEAHSDGIWWKTGSHLVHASGTLTRIQVGGGDFDGAAKKIGVDRARCVGGAYLGGSP